MTEREIQLAILGEIRNAIVCAAPNYTPAGWWECDLWAVTRSGYATEYEIKLTVSDFKADREKTSVRYDNGFRKVINKHRAMNEPGTKRPSRFFYVMPEELALSLVNEIPEWAGLGSAKCEGYFRRIRWLKPAPRLSEKKTTVREIRLCQRRMWYRYWEALKDIERLKDDRRRMAENGTA